VPRYRLSFINPTPRHVTARVEFDAADDHEAHAQVAALADGRAMEPWEDERLVHAFPGEHEP
jgi:hypothetical protein